MADQRSEGPAAEAGLTVAEYERRVWDMSRNLVHPAALYALVQVIGLTRLTSHAGFHQPTTGWWEWALFLASFLGAWAVFYSTLLRDAGLRSLTVSVLVPLAVVTLAVSWIALPGLGDMTASQALWSSIALAGPGPLAWIVTMLRWRKARREATAMLPDGADR